jgi:hypothetical protein
MWYKAGGGTPKKVGITYEAGMEGPMETTELKTVIGALEARAEAIRDWL